MKAACGHDCARCARLTADNDDLRRQITALEHALAEVGITSAIALARSAASSKPDAAWSPLLIPGGAA